MEIMKKASLAAHLPTINKKLIPLKMVYLIFLTALGCALPFRTVFAKQLGLSGAAVGAIFTIVPFTKIITHPLFGAIIDKFKRFRLTLTIIHIIVAFSHIIMAFLSPITPDPDHCIFKQNLRHPCNDTTSKFCTLKREMSVDVRIWNISCNFQCPCCQTNHEQRCVKQCNQQNMSVASSIITFIASNNSAEEEELDKNTSLSNVYPLFTDQILRHFPCLQTSPSNCTSYVCFKYTTSDDISGVRKVFSSSQFWSLLVLIGMSSSTFAAVLFLTDAVCYEILDNPDNYGYQRLWGSVGWGVGTLLGGYANELATGNSSVTDYTPCFYLLATLCIINIIPVLFIKVENVKFSDNIFKDVGRLLCSCHILSYAIMVLAVGLLSGLMWNYQMWFLEEIGASPFLLGLSMTAECFLAELPCFIIAGWVIKKIGHINCLSLAFLCYGLKYVGFSYMRDPWLSIPVGLLHGPTFGIFFASMTTYGKEHAPAGTEATVQALLAVTFEGIGAATGCLVGGLAFDTFGSRYTMWYAGMASFIFLTVNMILQLLLRNFKNRAK